MRNITDSTGAVNSVYPATSYLTFGPWLYLVPQYRPTDCLMLGFAGGTAAGLIRIFYGAVPITAVDIAPDTDGYAERYGVTFVQADAREYVRDSDSFDCVIVDLFEDGAYQPCEFVFSNEFASDVLAIGRYVIVHAHETSDMSAWDERAVKRVKTLSLNASRFCYYRTAEIHTLPIQ